MKALQKYLEKNPQIPGASIMWRMIEDKDWQGLKAYVDEHDINRWERLNDLIVIKYDDKGGKVNAHPDRKNRTCCKCLQVFMSAGKHNRICGNCSPMVRRASAMWR